MTKTKGCFVRLQLFSPSFHHLLNIAPGDRIANLDLDLVVTGPLDPLFDRKDDFTILQGINTTNPCPFNGSIWMLKAGARPDVWWDFSLENYAKYKVPFHAFPDDQGWFCALMPDAGAWGPEQGVYGFKKAGWPSGDALPDGARVVAFPRLARSCEIRASELGQGRTGETEMAIRISEGHDKMILNMMSGSA
jgi:hypothetical protein